jgi:Ser/Thr protein kinase RdoA (MazF antagonist)
MKLNELQREWLIPEPWSIRPITHGENNLTQVIDTSAGSYILRAYRSDRSLEQIRYELSVLSNLQEKSLPFRVPTPIPTVTGELFAASSGSIVTLSPWLSGSLLQDGNLEQAYAAGQALAELGKALTDIQVEVTPEVTPFPHSGDFQAWAGSPIDPAYVLGQLPITKELQRRTLALLEETQASAPALYQSLPQQIIHRDYDQSNILMEGNTVTGVLDFEFCGHDLRILDLAYALSKWPDGLWNTGKEWEIIDSFAQGYLGRQMLTLEELESLPLIFRLRATTSLYYRFGRYTRGIETQESMLERIQEALTDETWLQMHTEELLRHIRSWHH